jgi:hypothetical protein
MWNLLTLQINLKHGLQENCLDRFLINPFIVFYQITVCYYSKGSEMDIFSNGLAQGKLALVFESLL